MNRLIGQSPAFQQVIRAAQMVAATDAPVTIFGEHGAGKESLARFIHAHGRAAQGEFSVIHCASADVTTLQQAIDSAQLATLYLDQVEELSAECQAYLLAALQSDARRAGHHAVRLIAATSADLEQLVSSGEFRQDLFYQLYVVPLTVPSLRERREDIALLLKHFTQQAAKRYGRKPPRYSVSVNSLLKQYAWPGNIREMRNLCERLVILLAGATVQPENLPVEMRRTENAPVTSGFMLPETGVDLFALEGNIIQQAVNMSGGNRSKAARLLGLTRDTLLYRMQKHGIKLVK